MLVNSQEHIQKLIHAIEKPNKREFNAAFGRQMEKNKGGAPYSAVLVDAEGKEHPWLNMGCRADELTVATVNAIAPALKKAKIESVNFYGTFAHTEATKLLISLLRNPVESQKRKFKS